MQPLATIRRRHASQRLAGEPLASPADAVRWSGAVQAQEFAEVKWSLAERIGDARRRRDRAHALPTGEILRTHVMRPTWHFVAAEDLRWLLRLTAPRVHAANRYWYRQAGLDAPTLERSHELIARELADGEPRDPQAARRRAGGASESRATRRGSAASSSTPSSSSSSAAARAGASSTPTCCSTTAPPPIPGRVATRRSPSSRRRYFRSHGPATARDFSWWSGLTLTQARGAIGLCVPALERADDGDGTPWFRLGAAAEAPARHRALLLPTYDELIVAYKDLRVDLVREPPREGLLTRTIAIDGRTVGGWKRTLAKRSVTVEATAFAPLDRDQRDALERAVARFGDFLALEARLELTQA